MNKIQRLEKVLTKNSRRVIGLMSGMSMDGVDLALAHISGTYPRLEVRLEDSYFLPYPLQLKEALKKLRNGGTTGETSELNFRVAAEFARCVNLFLEERKMPPDSIDAIGSHGQTVFHRTGASSEFPSTLQIGSGSVIAQLTNILTVSNFRERDLAAGGVGAPLVPLFDFLLFRRDDEPVALNNLGSISNVTVVTPNLDDVLAFDTGPANMPIDFFAALLPGNADGIDMDGKLSAQGKVIDAMLQDFLKNPFFAKTPPKAAGFEEFGPPVLEAVRSRFSGHDPKDLLRTGVEFSAVTISDAYKNFVLPKFPKLHSIVFTGGGAKNPTLLNRVRELLPNISIESLDTSDRRFSDAKEALAFAVLANETLSGRPGNVKQVTGARESVTLGDISL